MPASEPDFDTLLRASAVSLLFTIPEKDSSGPGFAAKVRPSVEAVLTVTFKGGLNDRSAFRDAMGAIVTHADQMQKKETRDASAVILTHPDDVKQLLLRYAGLKATKPLVTTHVHPDLCEQVMVGYGGKMKPSVGEALAGYLSESGFLAADFQPVVNLMAPAMRAAVPAGNVNALQYYCRTGRNPKEINNSPSL